MKIRTGFVSNSSSSSFVIIGKDEDIKKAFDKVPKSLREEFRRLFLHSKNTVTLDGKEYLAYIGTYTTEELPYDENDPEDDGTKSVEEIDRLFDRLAPNAIRGDG